MRKIYPWFVRRFLVPLHSLWERNGYAGEWARLERSQWWSPERLRDLQEERLRELLAFARTELPFYRGRIPAESRESPWECLARLPLIDKATLQKDPASFQAGETWTVRATQDSTGGSTGQPLSYLVSHERWGTRKGATLRHDAWAGLDPSSVLIVLWGQPRDFPPPSRGLAAIRKMLMDRMMPVDASTLSESSFAELVRIIRDHPSSVLLAYGGALALFMRYLEKQEIGDLRVRSVISSAEVLPPGTRELVHTYLQAPVFDRYGCREFAVIATECEEHEGMHVNAEHLIVEILAEGRTAKPGEVGEIVVTDLLNRAQPFIRYRIGDLATPMEGACKCGRGLPRIKLLAGRVTEFIITPSRGWVSGVSLATYLITNLPGVAHVRIEQEERGEVLLRARAVEGAVLPQAELLSRATRFLGDDMHVRIVEDPTLEPEGSGKFRFSISRFSPFGVPLSSVGEDAISLDR